VAKVNFITAVGTPLTEDEALHEKGLEIHLQDQWNHGIGGVLVAGTMGAMQLLTDETYRRLIDRAVAFSQGRGEVLMGAGDAGFSRTRDRIRYLNQFKIDGVAVLAPYFWNYSQGELVEYYRALADESKAPLYLYDLPQIVKMSMTLETLEALSKHPNIRGAKCSGPINDVRQWLDHFRGRFRIIIANVEIMDILAAGGIPELLDGMWAPAPTWTMGVGECVHKGDREGAAEYTQKITRLRNQLVVYGKWAFTEWMNARGIPGIFSPRPARRITGPQREALVGEPIFQALVKENPLKLN
jgi:dihydrodipicolinate synthase/N-acetylneuraminate lyase